MRTKTRQVETINRFLETSWKTFAIGFGLVLGCADKGFLFFRCPLLTSSVLASKVLSEAKYINFVFSISELKMKVTKSALGAAFAPKLEVPYVDLDQGKFISSGDRT